MNQVTLAQLRQNQRLIKLNWRKVVVVLSFVQLDESLLGRSCCSCEQAQCRCLSIMYTVFMGRKSKMYQIYL